MEHRREDNILEPRGVLYGRTEARLLWTLGQYSAATRTERLLDKLVTDVYYSDSQDHDPPEIGHVVLRGVDSGAEIAVNASDPIGVTRAVATWTDRTAGWSATELMHDGSTRRFVGVIPGAGEAIVQVVDGVGNVAMADNDGALYRLGG